MAERSKQRKVDAENRQFNKEWTDKWLFVLPVGGIFANVSHLQRHGCSSEIIQRKKALRNNA